MSQIYNSTYFNRRNYLLEKAEDLNVTQKQLLLLLFIDYCNEYGKDCSMEILASKMHLDPKEIDELLSQLVASGYLKLQTKNRRIFFNIDGIFEEKPEKTDVRSIFSLFEDEFGRLLKQNELSELNQWLAEYEQNDILYALRQASIYNKKNMNYIRAILQDMKKAER